MSVLKLFCFIFLLFFISACGPQTEEGPVLTSINIIDRNGLAETISNEERLQKYENVDFLKEQPYQKVLRIYSRDQQGDIHAYVTSYHPNGIPKQYLEVVNNRAYGAYREWHINGVLKLEAFVIGGEADINTAAEQTWLFDGCSQVWDENNKLIAEIPYEKGILQGTSLYYHSNGGIWKRVPLYKGQIHGEQELYLENGSLLQVTTYCNGIKRGNAKRYWDGSTVAADEVYSEGLLQEGRYFNKNGTCVSEINEGAGFRAIFSKDSLSELHEYCHGVLAGVIKIFDKNGHLIRLYHIKDTLKHGEEVEYYVSYHSHQPLVPKLSIHWNEGRIQGLVKTWYPNGTQESQREMANNAKNGLLTAWYKDGTLMLIEEYERDKLVKGEYYPPGDRTPQSLVGNGRGIATLFDAEGNFLKKIHYQNGKPTPEV